MPNDERPFRPQEDSSAVTPEMSDSVFYPGIESLATKSMMDSKTLVGEASETSSGGFPAHQKIGKYEIRRQLGAGGMGAVFLAFDPMIEREVALKVLSPNLGNSPTALQRFLGEARAIGKLNHPHVVSIYEIDKWDDKYFLVMELLTGGSVGNRLDENGRQPWQEATRVVAQAARGLAAAHAAGLIHRDIKPDNLMLSGEGLVKVVDFGLSKLQDPGDQQTAVTRVGQILGTPQYMSPEQFEAAEVDHRTDVYSLGATYFHLLTARFPFHECKTIVQTMTAHLTKPVPLASQYVNDIPARCDEIIAKAMAKPVGERFQSALEMAVALEALLQSERESTSPQCAADVADRPLVDALIVEPSKLQAAILKDALNRSGTKTVRIATNAEQAYYLAMSSPPDLLITALELGDARGLDLVARVCEKSLLRQSTVVLNSSDSTLRELLNAGTAATRILAPKRVRPEDTLRIVHAMGPIVMPLGPLAEPPDFNAMRVVVELGSGRIPESLAKILRELQVLDVAVTPRFAAENDGNPPDLIISIRREQSLEDEPAAEQAVHLARHAKLAVIVQAIGDQLNLRAASQNGIVAVSNRPFVVQRLVHLFQACRL